MKIALLLVIINKIRKEQVKNAKYYPRVTYLWVIFCNFVANLKEYDSISITISVWHIGDRR